MMPCMPTPKRGRGRPKKLASTTSVTIDVQDAKAADELVPLFDRVSPLRMNHNRTDVLRACIKRGLDVFRAELGDAAQPQTRGAT